MMFGAWIGGVISDRIGRRFIFVTGLAVSSTAAFISSAATSYYPFLLLRFCMGMQELIFLFF